MPLNNHHYVSNIEITQIDSSLPHINNSSSINSTNTKCQTTKSLGSVSCTLQQYPRVKHYVQLPMYRIIHDKSTRTPILCSYDYVLSNHFQMPTHSHHVLLLTRNISHTMTFLRQPIFQGISFKSTCNVRHIFVYEKSQSQNIPLHASTIHTTLYTST